jgi:hypothetical protein
LTFNGTTLTTANDASISGLTVGKGCGSQTQNTAVGNTAIYSNSTGNSLSAFGYNALYNNTTGSSNTAIGTSALASNNTGSYNVAVGQASLIFNTTADNNTAVGYQAGYSNTNAGGIGVLGYQAGYSNTTGSVTGVGYQAGYLNTTGSNTHAFGFRALYSNTTGSSNVAVGRDCLYSNTTASNNTAVGYQAGYTNSTGASLTALGYQAGYSSTGNFNTFVGKASGYTTTGADNTFIGHQAGYSVTTGSGNAFFGSTTAGSYGAGFYVTTGSKNTILGSYNGNQGSLDIRTASNYIVLSDGDGNPRGTFTSGGWYKVQADSSYQDIAGLYHEFSSAQNNQVLIAASSNTGSGVTGIRSKLPAGANASAKFFIAELAGSGGVFQVIANGNVQNTNNSYGAISDIKLKENIVDATPKLADLMQVKVRNYNLKSDPSHKQLGVVAQELEQVFPSMIEETLDTDTEGNELGTTTKAVKYSVFVPILIKAIQELKAELDEYKATHP